MSRKTSITTAVLLALFLQGCSLAPEYLRPALPVAGSLPEVDGKRIGDARQMDKDGAELGWREYFVDPALRQLIATALDNNRDLRQAALTVESYQAQYRIQRAALLPSVTGAGSGAKQRAYSGGRHLTTEYYSASVGVTAYELDFFGRVKNLEENALEQYLALGETHRGARLSLVAEVARAYLTLLADREMLSITEETLKNEEESYRLVEQRASEGVSTQLALAQARIGVETARVNLAVFRRQVGQDQNNLTLLCGASPAVLPEAPATLSDRDPFPGLKAPLSSQVLLQRPDILAAEHELKGANASIGAARAAFFPSIGLTVSGGVTSGELSDLFAGSAGTWLFSPSITVPIFTAGRLEAQLDVAEIRKEISVAKYEKTIQNAFREVADALIALGTYSEQLTAQKANLQANLDYYATAKDRYREGLDSSLTLLDAQRSLFDARRAYVSLRLAQQVNQVNLYKVLGGGWQE